MQKHEGQVIAVVVSSVFSSPPPRKIRWPLSAQGSSAGREDSSPRPPGPQSTPLSTPRPRAAAPEAAWLGGPRRRQAEWWRSRALGGNRWKKRTMAGRMTCLRTPPHSFACSPPVRSRKKTKKRRQKKPLRTRAKTPAGADKNLATRPDTLDRRVGRRSPSAFPVLSSESGPRCRARDRRAATAEPPQTEGRGRTPFRMGVISTSRTLRSGPSLE